MTRPQLTTCELTQEPSVPFHTNTRPEEALEGHRGDAMNSPLGRPSDARTPSSNEALPGDLLVLYRKRSGFRQEELAEKLGLKSRRTIYTWETNTNAPNPDSLRKLLALYLRQGVFVPGQEMQEAAQLWDSVKNL